MRLFVQRRRRRIPPAAMVALLMALLLVPLAPHGVTAAAIQDGSGEALSGTVTAAGSSTLGPMVQAAGEAFAEEATDVAIEVDRSSSGAGLEAFCAGDTDLANSGRRINDKEEAACASADVAYDEFAMAFDGVVVVVNSEIDFVDCLTVDQLGEIWQPDSAVATWQDLDPAWPANEVALFGTGEESGTYQFFTQQVVGEEGSSRDDYTVTDGHPATADGVAESDNGLGFLPFPRYAEREDDLTLVEVDGGDGCTAPSAETIRDGGYAPLSRELYLYANRQNLERSEVAEFLRFLFADAAGFAEDVGLVASPDETYETNLTDLEDAIAGTSNPDGPETAATAAAGGPAEFWGGVR